MNYAALELPTKSLLSILLNQALMIIMCCPYCILQNCRINIAETANNIDMISNATLHLGVHMIFSQSDSVL